MGTTNNGYEIFETDGGVCYDVSFDPDTGDDVIVVDGVEGYLYLTKSDLQTMLDKL